MEWEMYEAGMEETINAYIISVGKSERKRLLGGI
jgi:hypothetical protein